MATDLATDTDSYRRRLAYGLANQALDTSPKGSWTQGAAQLAQALLAGQMIRQDKEEQEAKDKAYAAALMGLPGLGGGQEASSLAPATSAPTSFQPGPKLAPLPSRVYDQNEMTPLDAAVATNKELASGVKAPPQYAALFGKAAIDNDIPVNVLTAQAKQESGFNPNIVSSAGAQGISQFMPGTAKEFGINPFDPKQAIPAQAQYLRQNIDRFGGSIPLGLAAYNAGPQRVVNAGGDLSRMPEETQKYVPAIMNNAGRVETASADPNFVPQSPVQAPQAAPQAQPQPAPQQVAQAGPSIPPNVAASIRQNMASPDPRVRQLGMQLYQQYAKPQQQTSDIQEYEYARRQGFAGSLTDFLQRKRAGAGEYGLQPIYGVDKDGNPVIMQLGKGGDAVQSKLPEGVKISKEPIKIDAGTNFILIDPVTRQQIGQPIPKNVAEKATQEKVGEAKGDAVVNLPNVEAKSDLALKTIERIRNHPGRNSIGSVGTLGWLPGVPGTAQRGFVNLVDQAKGQTFLQAFETLKGGGAITEIEGAKATQALARLDRSQSDEDFNAALSDLESVIKSGMERARQKAGMASQRQAPQQPSVDDLLKKYGAK